MPRFIYDRLNPNEYNFRLWRATAEYLARTSPCNFLAWRSDTDTSTDTNTNTDTDTDDIKE